MRAACAWKVPTDEDAISTLCVVDQPASTLARQQLNPMNNLQL